jgi:hypothetical protein
VIGRTNANGSPDLQFYTLPHIDDPIPTLFFISDATNYAPAEIAVSIMPGVA